MKLQEKAKKKISYAFTLMILLILIISSLTNNIYASEGTIEYGGSVSYSGRYFICSRKENGLYFTKKY